ncbi:hypothetical protein ZIOFF_001774 [Zingiber officinale]|uniref:Uncharacterized protein n=1 Tax=Zingiber officinale TaxID=94328 RepID=A0A8J5I653_ZINOF|nr:hypothetical protein ZIOFF_001774 [Zingiber officinale]
MIGIADLKLLNLGMVFCRNGMSLLYFFFLFIIKDFTITYSNKVRNQHIFVLLLVTLPQPGLARIAEQPQGNLREDSADCGPNLGHRNLAESSSGGSGNMVAGANARQKAIESGKLWHSVEEADARAEERLDWPWLECRRRLDREVSVISGQTSIEGRREQQGGNRLPEMDRRRSLLGRKEGAGKGTGSIRKSAVVNKTTHSGDRQRLN